MPPPAQTDALVTETPTADLPAEKEPVTLVWYYSGDGMQKDTETVNDKVNELVKQYPGLEHVTIVLKPFTGDEYKQGVTLAFAANDQIDIIGSYGLDSLATLVDDGIFMSLDDLISDNLRAVMPEWLWNLGSIMGSVYMVPSYGGAFNSSRLLFAKDYMDKYGDYEAMTAILTDPAATLQEKSACLEEYVMAVRAGEGDTKYLHPLLTSRDGSLGYGFFEPYDSLGNDFLIKHGSDEVEFLFEMEDQIEIFRIHAEWFDKGLIAPDGISTNNGDYNGKSMLNPVSYVYSVNGVAAPTTEYASTYYSGVYGLPTLAIDMQQYDYVRNAYGCGGNGISGTCENPEEAILFLECINAGSELGNEIYNTIVYGLEDVHYTKNNDGSITTLEYDGGQGGIDTSYSAFSWSMGNWFNAWENQSFAEGLKDNILQANMSPDTVGSDIPDFAVDKSKVSTQIDQINAVVTEYYDTFYFGVTGSTDFEAKYQEFLDKLELAGLQEVKAEYQAQLDAYLAAK